MTHPTALAPGSLVRVVAADWPGPFDCVVAELLDDEGLVSVEPGDELADPDVAQEAWLFELAELEPR